MPLVDNKLVAFVDDLFSELCEFLELRGGFGDERWLAALLGGGVGDEGAAVGFVVATFGGHAVGEVEAGFGDDFVGFGGEGVLG